MINTVVAFSQGIKRFFSHVKELPLINRIFAYLLFLIASVLFIASAVFCLFEIWVLIEHGGRIFDNPPAEEWDIR